MMVWTTAFFRVDVSAELARMMISSLHGVGPLQASSAVKAALSGLS
jgi:hypothetical protein